MVQCTIPSRFAGLDGAIYSDPGFYRVRSSSRLNELGRMAVMKDDDGLLALSRQMIEGNVNNRFGTWEYAVQVALADLFTQPVVRYIYSDWTDWWHLFDQPYLADVAADPRVSAEIERWTDEIAALREDARGYLADRAAGNIERL